MIERDWYNCYSEGWTGGLIVPEAFAHPAKFARGLIRRVYEHAIEQGWFRAGDAIVDPFAGVALGALHAQQRGLHWVGVELEQPFIDMGRSCDCTGISKADWVRFYGRWERARYLEGRYWCPRCIMQARNVVAPLPQETLFDPRPPTASYVRNSGEIPSTAPHHYEGNLEEWHKLGLPGTATLLQGDSRELARVLGRAVGGSVSSPPYAETPISVQGADGTAQEWNKAYREYQETGHWQSFQKQMSEKAQQAGYSGHPSNLGNLRASDADHAATVAGAVSSPPYAGGCQHTGGDDPKPEHVQGGTFYGVGITGAVSSPPYIASLASDDPDKRGGLFRDPKRRNDKTLTAEYGESVGQLGVMLEGEFAGAISSPPYAESITNRSETTIEGDREHRAQIGRNPDSAGSLPMREYGRAPGQLASLPEGAHGAALAQGSVSSPPYEGGTLPPNNIRKGVREERESRLGIKLGGGQLTYGTAYYSSSDGNIGQEQGDTFWAAARTIMEQLHAVLAPGAHTIWVVKAFVRNKQRVDFPNQWRELGEACGFKTMEWIRAHLVEGRGAQFTLEGDLDERTVERKSFFRRLAERKGSPRIDYEVVLVQRKQ